MQLGGYRTQHKAENKQIKSVHRVSDSGSGKRLS